MKYHEFLARVRERGEYADQQEAESVVRPVLTVLGERLAAGEHRDLAAQLPAELADAMRDPTDAGESIGMEEFLRKVADQLGPATIETARWDASAVLSTLAESIDGGELNQLISQLPASYATLFGHPELA